MGEPNRVTGVGEQTEFAAVDIPFGQHSRLQIQMDTKHAESRPVATVKASESASGLRDAASRSRIGLGIGKRRILRRSPLAHPCTDAAYCSPNDSHKGTAIGRTNSGPIGA